MLKQSGRAGYKMSVHFDRERRHRRSIRLEGYDYTQPGSYVVTPCVHGRECLFGEIVDGEIHLNDRGDMVRSAWHDLPGRCPGLSLDAFVIMPNHVHGIIILPSRRGESRIRPGPLRVTNVAPQKYERRAYTDPKQGDHKDRPYGTAARSLGRFIQAFKSITTGAYIIGVRERGWPPFAGRLWQRNYYEHIIRNEDDLTRARTYIVENPAR